MTDAKTTKKRTRARRPDNRTTTGFRVSNDLWNVLASLLPVPVNTHRFGGGGKRRLLTEGLEVPLGLMLDGANRHDMQRVRPTLESRIVECPHPTDVRSQGLCLDKGYDDDEVRAIVQGFGFTAHIRGWETEAQALKADAGEKARRWGVERSHSGMNRFRRVVVRWDKKSEHYLAFLHFACALIALRAAGLFR